MTTSELEALRQRVAELEASEAYLRQILATITEVVLVFDQHGRYRDIIPTNADMLYKPPAELQGKTLHEVMPAAHADRFLATIQEVLTTRQSSTIEYILPVPAGELWFEATISPLDETNVLWVARDITERRKKEETARHSEQLLNIISSNLPLVIYTLDKDGIFTRSEGKALEKLGLQAGQVVGMSVFDLYKDEPEIIAHHQQAFAGDSSCYASEVGDFFFESWILPICNPNNDVTGILGVALDISESRQAEQAMRRAQQLLNTITSHLPVIVFMLNHEGIYTLSEGKALEKIGFQQNEAVGLSALEMFQDDPSIVANLKKTLAGEPASYISEVGNTIFEVWAVPILDNHNQVNGVIGIGLDVTDLRQAEQASRRNQKLLQTIANNAPIMLFMLTHEGIITFSEGKGMERQGLQPGQTIGLSALDLYRDVPDVLDNICRVLAGEQVHFVSNINNAFTENWMFPEYNADGQVTGVIGLGLDITERRQAEQEQVRLKEEMIQVQQAALRELSTPLIPISDRVVIMPLIGHIDSSRAQLVLETLLVGVAEHQAEIAILDITGVPAVDAQVADALIHAAQAVKLLGAQVILTGIQPRIAQILVELDVNLEQIMTHGTLQTGIAVALRR